MIISIGEVLYDIFPEYRRIGGAPFNFSFHLHSLGIPVTFISRIGDDENGRDILEFLNEIDMRSSFVQVDPVHQSGHVSVALDGDGVPRFEIAADVAYDYIEYTDAVDRILNQAEFIYFGTLVQRAPTGAQTIKTILERTNSRTTCFYDINLRPGCYTIESIRTSLACCDILKLNKEELDFVKGILAFSGNNEDVVRRLMDRFSIGRVSLTMGKNGSTLFTAENKFSSVPKESAAIQGDTVGAGDAYAAILALGLLRGWNPSTVVERATKFAGKICDIKGAVPEDRDFYKPFLSWL